MKDMIHGSEELKQLCTPKSYKPEYPGGLRLHLGPAELKKLGIKNAHELGEKFTIEAVAEVMSVNKEDQDKSDKGFNISLQIKKMDAKSEKDKKPSSESIIYGG